LGVGLAFASKAGAYQVCSTLTSSSFLALKMLAKDKYFLMAMFLVKKCIDIVIIIFLVSDAETK
jgi:hypothetical protein